MQLLQNDIAICQSADHPGHCVGEESRNAASKLPHCHVGIPTNLASGPALQSPHSSVSSRFFCLLGARVSLSPARSILAPAGWSCCDRFGRQKSFFPPSGTISESMGGVGWRVASKVQGWGWNCLRGFASAAIPSDLECVGFIGLGNMGSHMARNLMVSGYKVFVHDVNENAMKKFADDGIPTLQSPLEVSELSDVIVTMLPSSAHVLDVYSGRNGLLGTEGRLRPWLYIDSSTVDPQTSRKISMDISGCHLKEKKGYAEIPMMLDAPVSGGVPAAKSGTLTFMVGGLEEAYLAAKPLLLSMGKNAIYCGGAGNGSAAKICNNMAMAISMLGVSEAFALGQNLGIKANILTNIFNCSSARCWSSDTYNPVPGVMTGVPSSRNYDGGFTSKLMAKDLDLALASASGVDSTCSLGSEALEIYRKLCEDGYEFKDFSCAFRHYYSGKDEK